MEIKNQQNCEKLAHKKQTKSIYTQKRRKKTFIIIIIGKMSNNLDEDK